MSKRDRPLTASCVRYLDGTLLEQTADERVGLAEHFLDGGS